MTRSPSDVLSLTLPKALGRARAKRRPKPPWLFWFYLVASVVYVGLALWAFLVGRVAPVIVDAAGAGLNWKIALHVRSGGSPAVFLPWLLTMVAAAVAAAFLP